jgi:metal-dependent HD superfamily phosphatase/phosphodiesterase
MSEDVNDRIIKKIYDGPYKKNVKEFLLWAIREELHKQGTKWIYKDEYNLKINHWCDKETK